MPPNLNGVNPCGSYQYWDTRFDGTCQTESLSSSGLVTSIVDKGGSWNLKIVQAGGLPNDTSTVTDNRWVVFKWVPAPDGSVCPGENDTSPNGGLDDVLYTNPPEPEDPEETVVVPPVDPDACVDNLEVRFGIAGCLSKVFSERTAEDSMCVWIFGPKQ